METGIVIVFGDGSGGLSFCCGSLLVLWFQLQVSSYPL